MRALKLGVAVLAAAAFGLVGCGGGGGGNSNTSEIRGSGSLGPEDPQLAFDGSWIEQRDVRAPFTGTMTVLMQRGTLDDPYLIVGLPDGDGIRNDRQDDNSGGNRDARVTYNVSDGVVYRIWFNTSQPGDRGTYSYIIRFDRSRQAGPEAAGPAEARRKTL